jgi:hypothetical protein
MLSFTMQVPLISTASQGMTVPFNGMTMTSPGTRSVEKISSISEFKERIIRREYSLTWDKNTANK